MKQSFQSEWLALPKADVRLVLSKVHALSQDPKPDGHLKQKILHAKADLYRVRAGDYRLFYVFDRKYVCLLALRRRDGHTYDEAIDAEFIGGMDAGPDLSGAPRQQTRGALLQPRPPSRPLPRRIDRGLLTRLRVPQQFHDALVPIEDEDGLLSCDRVPDEHLLRIHEALFERSAEEVLQAPEYVVQTTEDLERFKEGSLLAFLLRLDEDQEKYVTWASSATGPTLLKGGPGTGKSTVALYRVRTMLEKLRADGVVRPRLLFTTYTNALVGFSRQLLQSLLGRDARDVEVRTADSLVMSVLRAHGRSRTVASVNYLRTCCRKAMETAPFQGTPVERKAQRKAVERLGVEYVLEEVCQVIDARRLECLDAYLEARRPGRCVPLNATQRRAIWAVRVALHARLDQEGLTTWERMRAVAADLVLKGAGPPPYDGVIIDEAQDLDPSVLQMLVALCASPGRLFLTADANQAMYGSGFRWTDVHDSLRFRGRTGVLRVNHRSTAEIARAAASYLASGAQADGDPDDELQEADDGPRYVHHGPLPAMRRVTTTEEEEQLLSTFLPRATRDFGFGLSAAAVLVPTEKAGERIATALAKRGIRARFMPGRQLKLAAQAVKVLTLQSSKGLEFPVVAIAGLTDKRWRPLYDRLPEEEREERLAEARRRMFVAMSRAMRALLVIAPRSADTPLLSGFDDGCWDVADA